MVVLQPHMARGFSGQDFLEEWYEDKYIATRSFLRSLDQDKS